MTQTHFSIQVMRSEANNWDECPAQYFTFDVELAIVAQFIQAVSNITGRAVRATYPPKWFNKEVHNVGNLNGAYFTPEHKSQDTKNEMPA